MPKLCDFCLIFVPFGLYDGPESLSKLIIAKISDVSLQRTNIVHKERSLPGFQLLLIGTLVDYQVPKRKEPDK